MKNDDYELAIRLMDLSEGQFIDWHAGRQIVRCSRKEAPDKRGVDCQFCALGQQKCPVLANGFTCPSGTYFEISGPLPIEDAVSVEGLQERYQAATTKRNTAPKTTFAALQGQQFRTPRKPRDWAVTWLALGILLIGGIIGSALGHIALYFLIMGVFK